MKKVKLKIIKKLKDVEGIKDPYEITKPSDVTVTMKGVFSATEAEVLVLLLTSWGNKDPINLETK